MDTSIGPYPERARLETLLRGVARTRVAVVGDFCLDWYFDIDTAGAEVSIETALPTWPVRRIRTAPGGAGNVVTNLCALGVQEVRCFGVVGADPFASVLTTHLRALGSDVAGLVTQAVAWTTPTYMKPLVDGVERNRIDAGAGNALSNESAERVLAALAQLVETIDVLIVNQQLARGGVHTPAFRAGLARIAPRARIVVVDAREHADAYAGAIRKLNEREAVAFAEALDLPLAAGSGLADVAAALADHWGDAVCVTRGGEGALVAEPGGGAVPVPGIVTDGPIDTVGAGDAFVASFAAALGAGADGPSAARLANLAAAVTVRTIGATGSASPEQILDAAEQVVYRFRPEIAASPEAARLVEQSEIEIVTRFPAARPTRHVVFDHDGTISTLREGWEAVMEPLMVGAILGLAPDSAGGSTAEPATAAVAEVRAAVREFIARTTGVQTLGQMEGLRELVRRFGFVPEEAVLSAAAYKARYNAALMRIVERRTAKVARGELSVDDVTVKGAVSFLQRLAQAGLVLHLASGTDEDDVVREATLLGYAALFTGGIHGARGSIDHEPKRVVLQGILRELQDGGASGTPVVIGDGPVEIREGVRAGALTVGVASDEVRRFGRDDAKRARLVRAGADLIVPDYSAVEPLTRLLCAGALLNDGGGA